MKFGFYSVAALAAATMTMATSCSNETIDEPQGNEAQVSFTVGVEGQMATTGARRAMHRAMSDGSQPNNSPM